MSSKPTQTHTPSFTIISRMQCWLYSIRVQIIMSHFFHIKKKSIIISIVLVKFLTIVRWMYKIPSERGHKSTSTTHQRVREAIHCGNCSLASSGHKIGWICAHKASRSMIAICFGIYLSFTVSCMLCVHGLRVIHNQHFEPFEFCDLQYIQYCKFLETAPLPFLRVWMTSPPPYLKVWIRHWLLLCSKVSPLLVNIFWKTS